MRNFEQQVQYDAWRVGGGKIEGQKGLTAVEKWGENNFLDLVKSFKVFDDDLSLVGHDDRRILPWNSPNPVGQYTLTYLPEKWAEGGKENMKELAAELEGTTDIVVSCMDKDVANGVHKSVSQHSGRRSKIFGIFIGGGPVQNSYRQQALDFIGFYLYKIRQYGGLPNLETIWTIAHNHQCGAVKHFLGGVPLHDYLTDLLNENVVKQGQIESGVMMALARNGVYRFEDIAYLSPNRQMFVGLADTFRDGRGGIRLISAGNGPKLSVDNLDSDYYVRQAAKFIKFT